MVENDFKGTITPLTWQTLTIRWFRQRFKKFQKETKKVEREGLKRDKALLAQLARLGLL
jgi:hypothetical protein